MDAAYTASRAPASRAAPPATLAALAAVWIIVVQWLFAAAGGYPTGRLRTRSVGTHIHGIFFRDTAHRRVLWAVAAAIVAILVAFAGYSLLAGGLRTATSMATDAAQSVGGDQAQAGQRLCLRG